jgi:ParB-like chromosome segregation protein Spo0J
VLITIKTSDVVVGQRLRKVDEKKVEELAQSIKDLGRLINPISIDEKNNLIAGNHRLSAHKLLGIEEIPAIVFDADELMSKLIQIDENLYINPQDFITQSECIQQREIILQSLGKRTKRGDNRFTDKEENVFSTDALAEKLGVSNRVYRLRRQVSNLIPSVRNALRGTRHANNLVDLVILSRLEDEVQERVAGLVSSDNSNRSLKLLINEAKIQVHTPKDRKKCIEEIKKKFGVPYSLMRFDKEDSILENMMRDISSICNNKRVSSFMGENLGNYVGFCNQSLFLLDYFVREENPIIMDNFMGNGVNIITALFLGMDVIGFDLDAKKVDTVYDACDYNFEQSKFDLFNEDGVEMKPLKNKSEYLDGICSDPPYLNGLDVYTKEEKDLSNMGEEEFLSKMEACFKNYYRLIKTSSVDDKKFYPVMVKMNYSRKGKRGVVSMDFLLNDIAERVGFTLWDRTVSILKTPLAAVNIPRVHNNCFTIKNWETTLIWIKQ